MATSENPYATGANSRSDLPEHWQLQHPTYGLIEVFIGTPAQLVQIDPAFPEKAVAKDSGKSPSPQRKLASFEHQLVAKVDGVVIARRKDLSNVKVGLKENPKPIKDGDYDYKIAIGAPYIEIESNALSSWVRTVRVRARGKLIELDAPEGSKAAKRQKAMEESPFKRWFYPLLAGLGKGGWAIALLILMPLLDRILPPIIDWIKQFFPDWDINLPSPDLNLPRIPFPEVNLPSIPWPDINLPSLNLPDWTAPGWLEFLLEYNKVWVPIIIGIAIGIVAVRNARRSRETKLQWERERLATALSNRVKQLEHADSP